MIKNAWSITFMLLFSMLIYSCSDEPMNDANQDARKVEVSHLSKEMIKVRDYVPENAIMAHRGTTFWAPEETEAAFRWAREIGADYLEADLQVSKDGVILALHDDNLKRTTNIENVYGENLPPERKQYYIALGYSEKEAEEKVKEDKKNFIPNLTSYYTYKELMKLDAGAWFNEKNFEQARKGFVTHKQYISTLEDLVAFARGKKIKRNAEGKRIYRIVGKTGKIVKSLSGVADEVKYDFAYEADNVDSGNRPGIYIEFKEPWLNPSGFENMVYDELTRLGMNAITKPEIDIPHYKDHKINVGNTNGKVVLQTFSLQSLVKVSEVFKGKIPMCFLLWKGTGATDISNDSPEGYASFINLGVKYKAHIIGPSIAGAPNNYPELDAPWQAYLIKEAGMLNHPYSFDTRDQMKKYYGDFNYGISNDNLFSPPYLDGMFTNRAEMTLQYFIDKGVRPSEAPQTVPNAEELLTRLGYAK